MSNNIFPAQPVIGELLKYTQVGSRQTRLFTKADDVVNIDALAEKGLQYKLDRFKDDTIGRRVRLGLLFLNPSMRTRMSTQIAAKNLGMDVIVFNIDKEGCN